MRPPVRRALLGALLCVATTAVSSPASASAPTSAPTSPPRRPVAAVPARLPHGLGAIPPGARVEASATVCAQRRVAQSLPTAVDLSVNTPSIGDQGQVGSCAPWAIGYSILG